MANPNLLSALLSMGSNSASSPQDSPLNGTLASLAGIGNSGGVTGGTNWFNNTDTLGNINSGVNALSGLFNIYSGVKGLNQAKDVFNFNRDLARTNLSNQSNLVNEQLATRQATRLRSQGVNEQDIAKGVSDFMAKYGVSGSIGG